MTRKSARPYSRIATVLRCQIPQRSYDALVRELGRVAEQDSDPAMLSALNTDQAVTARLHEALSHPRFKWRSLDQVAPQRGSPQTLRRGSFKSMIGYVSVEGRHATF